MAAMSQLLLSIYAAKRDANSRRDERLWSEQRDVYLALLDWFTTFQEAWLFRTDSNVRHDTAWAAPDGPDLGLFVRVNAFGDPEIARALYKMTSSISKHRSAHSAYLRESEPYADNVFIDKSEAELERRREAYVKAENECATDLDSFLSQIRSKFGAQGLQLSSIR